MNSRILPSFRLKRLAFLGNFICKGDYQKSVHDSHLSTSIKILARFFFHLFFIEYIIILPYHIKPFFLLLFGFPPFFREKECSTSLSQNLDSPNTPPPPKKGKLKFLAIFRKEITTILITLTSEEGEWEGSGFSFWRSLITNPRAS